MWRKISRGFEEIIDRGGSRNKSNSNEHRKQRLYNNSKISIRYRIGMHTKHTIKGQTQIVVKTFEVQVDNTAVCILQQITRVVTYKIS